MRRTWGLSLFLAVMACDAEPETKGPDSGSGVEVEAGDDDHASADAGEGAGAGADRCDSEAQPEPPELPGKVRKVEVGEWTFSVHSAGPRNGEAVVLLHGFPQLAREWAAQMQALADAGYRVIAPDQRGYSKGARPKSVEDYTLLLLSQDVLELADALGVERFHLVGHDWGAVVAWVIGALAPDRLLSLTPISATHPDAWSEGVAAPDSCQSAASSYIETFVSPQAESILLLLDRSMLRGMYAGLHPTTATAYLDFFVSARDLRGPLNWYRANFDQDPASRQRLGPVRVPTMFVWGDADFTTCRETAELVGEYVEAPYRSEVIHGVGHWVPELAADELNALLLDHLGDPQGGD